MSHADQILPLTETLAPAEQADVAEAVRDACRSGTPVYPIGGGTSLRYGVRATSPGLGLSLAGLNRVVDYPARDLTITVEPGITIAELAGRLAAERQRLPVDVRRPERATVGGVVATSPSGPRRYRYGTLRDYVIGMRAVDGRGTVYSGGGRVVKNAAGYDLCRLLTGSLGTIGVITQVSLMVKPMPETSAWVACDPPDFDAAERLLAGLVHTATLPAAIEFVIGPAWQHEPGLARQEPSGAGRLLAGFEGTSAEVEWMAQRLEEEWGGVAEAAAKAMPTAIRGDDATAVWNRLTEFPAEAGAGGDSDSLVVQVGALPGATVEMIRLLLGVDPDCSIQAHAGDGILRAQFAAEPSEMAALVGRRLRPVVSGAGGSMVVLSYPDGVELGREQVWGPPGDGAAVMQAIKSRFDPEGILNPGRFVYGNP